MMSENTRQDDNTSENTGAIKINVVPTKLDAASDDQKAPSRNDEPTTTATLENIATGTPDATMPGDKPIPVLNQEAPAPEAEQGKLRDKERIGTCTDATSNATSTESERGGEKEQNNNTDPLATSRQVNEPGKNESTSTARPQEGHADVATNSAPEKKESLEKQEDLQGAMLANLKLAKADASHAGIPAAAESSGQDASLQRKELKCKSCSRCKDDRVPVAILQKMEGGNTLAVKFNPQCGHGCTIVINNAFEITEHVCTAYQEKQDMKDGKLNLNDFDFDKFISGSEDLDDFLLKQKTRQASKLVSLEDQMKVAVKKLVKPLAVLVPTAVQKKSEAQLRAEREDRLRQIVEVEANLIYLRVLEFEKAATGNNSYPIDKLGKMLKDLDKRYITGFIQKVNNDFLISYNEQTQIVRFYNPSKPEIEILSREFEKWLRFNRL